MLAGLSPSAPARLLRRRADTTARTDRRPDERQDREHARHRPSPNACRPTSIGCSPPSNSRRDRPTVAASLEAPPPRPIKLDRVQAQVWHPRSPMTKVVEARQLCKSFRGKRAVDGVDLVVRAGERVALLGANGAGKTTTLLMLLG